MELETFQYKKGQGWTKKFPDLDSEQTLILVFGASEFRENLLPIQELSQNYPNSKIIGCSTAGEIAGSYVSDNTLSVAVVRFESTLVKVIKTGIDLSDSNRSFLCGKEIADQLKSDNLRAIFVLSDGLKVNGSELVEGLNTIEKKDVVITGGLAGDGKLFKQTWVLFNREIHVNHVVAVGLYGNHIQIGHASRGGWDIFGLERRVTRSKGNILYELDNKPALGLYKEYLGDRAKELPASGLLYPLAIRKNLGESKKLVRTILAVDEKAQSLIFAGDIPTGYFAQLMHANFERLITSANEAGEIVRKRLLDREESSSYSNPNLLIAISCVGRRLLLGERIEEETEAVFEAMPEGTKQVGFYSYGELSPYATGKCDLHNQTMTLTMFSEKK